MRPDAAEADANIATKVDHGHWAGDQRYDQWQDRAAGMIVKRWLLEHKSADAALDRLRGQFDVAGSAWWQRYVGEALVTALEIISADAMSAPPYAVCCPE
jgi:hypothetical protein